MMESHTLGAVIVGAGFGVVTHVRALRAAGYDVKALVGRNSEKTAQRAASADIPLALTHFPEALALPGVDVVVIATPPHSHASLSLEAIAAGKHVVCEKPFARNVEEAAEMLAAAQTAGVHHYIGTEHRWDTGQALATQAIHNGVIGRPRSVTSILQVPMLRSSKAEVPPWWGDAQEGGGWLGAYGSHQIDFMLDLFGPFAGVSASLQVLSEHGWTADDSFSCHFRSFSGVDGIFQSSVAALGPPLIQFRILGDGGTLEMLGDHVFVYDQNGKRELEPDAALLNEAPKPADQALMVTAYDKLHASGMDVSPFTKLYRSFAAQMSGGPDPYPIKAATFVEGLAMQQVLDAMRQSSTTGAWVEISAS